MWLSKCVQALAVNQIVLWKFTFKLYTGSSSGSSAGSSGTSAQPQGRLQSSVPPGSDWPWRDSLNNRVIKFHSGRYKYNTRVGDERIARVLGTSCNRNELIGAAYADSTWKKIDSALNTFKNLKSQSARAECEKYAQMRPPPHQRGQS